MIRDLCGPHAGLLGVDGIPQQRLIPQRAAKASVESYYSLLEDSELVQQIWRPLRGIMRACRPVGFDGITQQRRIPQQRAARAGVEAAVGLGRGEAPINRPRNGARRAFPHQPNAGLPRALPDSWVTHAIHGV